MFTQLLWNYCAICKISFSNKHKRNAILSRMGFYPKLIVLLLWPFHAKRLHTVYSLPPQRKWVDAIIMTLFFRGFSHDYMNLCANSELLQWGLDPPSPHQPEEASIWAVLFAKNLSCFDNWFSCVQTFKKGFAEPKIGSSEKKIVCTVSCVVLIFARCSGTSISGHNSWTRGDKWFKI